MCVLPLPSAPTSRWHWLTSMEEAEEEDSDKISSYRPWRIDACSFPRAGIGIEGVSLKTAEEAAGS